MSSTIRILGYLSLFFGGIASTFTFIKFYWPLPCVIAGFLGFLFSSLYVLLNSRYQVNKSKLTPGLAGLVLSSVPIIFFLVLMLMKG